MNTVLLLLNGRTVADIAMLPERQRASLTMIPVRSPSYSSLMEAGPYQNVRTPPKMVRRQSRDSPGWYNTEGAMTLDDFARRLNTTTKRIERWQGACAQNVVMALMRPTPIVLFLFNPVSLMLGMLVALWYFISRNPDTSSLFASP